MDTIDASSRYTVVNVTLPAKTADNVTTITLPNGWLDAVTILWPPGANALVGMRVVYAGSQIVPWPLTSAATYALGSGERLTIPVGMYMPGPIAVHNINNDNVQHTIYQTFVWHTWDAAPALAPISTVVA